MSKRYSKLIFSSLATLSLFLAPAVAKQPRAKPPAGPRAAALSLAPQVAPGGTQSVAWSGLDSPTAKDWVGLFAPGSAGTAYLDWAYTNGQAAGIVTVKIDAGRPAGLYEWRLYRNDGYTLAGTGGMIQVGAPAPAPAPPPPAALGPRGAVGADAPLAAADPALTGGRVTVQGFTAAAITAACQQAAQSQAKVVFLPAGTYRCEREVALPGGLTLLGAGALTVVSAPLASSRLFAVTGSQVRLTRLTLSGYSTTWTDANSGAAYNSSRGVEALGAFHDLRVDHCDVSGFCYALLFEMEVTAQVDHCFIHDNPVIGLGYGIAEDAGCYLLAMDNEFSDCRHALATNDQHAGYRPSHWEFIHNRVHDAQPSPNQQAAVDTHPQFVGTFLVEGNRFDANPDSGVGLAAGSGRIQGNQFSNLHDAIRLYNSSQNNVTGLPHDISISANTFIACTNSVTIRDQADNITVDGSLLPATAPGGAKYRANPPVPPAWITLQPMGADGILRWTPAAKPGAKPGAIRRKR